jgi:hypothetical protein
VPTSSDGSFIARVSGSERELNPRNVGPAASD